MTIETLTAEERRWLETDPDFQKWDVRRKVLRIIDAHAAKVSADAEKAEALAAEWKQTAEGYRLELQVLRTENEKLIARFPRG